MFSLTSPQRDRHGILVGGLRVVESGATPTATAGARTRLCGGTGRPKAGVAPDPTMTPPAAIARADAVVKTNVANDITNTAAEGRAEI